MHHPMNRDSSRPIVLRDKARVCKLRHQGHSQTEFYHDSWHQGDTTDVGTVPLQAHRPCKLLRTTLSRVSSPCSPCTMIFTSTNPTETLAISIYASVCIRMITLPL